MLTYSINQQSKHKNSVNGKCYEKYHSLQRIFDLLQKMNFKLHSK